VCKRRVYVYTYNPVQTILYTIIPRTTYYQEHKAQMEIGAHELYCIGNRCAHGNGVPKDKEVAVHFYMMAAQKMYPPAQCDMGICYIYGIGVKKDIHKAFEWFRQGAQQGHARSQYNMGLCLAGGRGVEQDTQQASEWIAKSATQGHTVAKRKLIL
jgi:TPR repeat protein